jgi:hypothetical protein
MKRTIFLSTAIACALVFSLACGIAVSNGAYALPDRNSDGEVLDTQQQSLTEWTDGFPWYQAGNSVEGVRVSMVTSFMGYHGSPKVGEPYDAHLVVQVNNPHVGYVPVKLGVYLPPNTQFASDGTHKIRCYYHSGSTQKTEEVTNDSSKCNAVPTQLTDGAWEVGHPSIPAYGTMEIQFPLRTTGATNGTVLTGHVDASGFGDPAIAKPSVTLGGTAPPPATGSSMTTRDLVFRYYPFRWCLENQQVC